jgi:hypothetical protein
MSDLHNENEKTMQRVADLALAGQGCAVWDEIESLNLADRNAILTGAQSKSANRDPREIRNLPGISIDLAYGARGINIALFDDRQRSLRTEILNSKDYIDFTDHTCVNLTNLDDTKK